jgi:hypothetical protein
MGQEITEDDTSIDRWAERVLRSIESDRATIALVTPLALVAVMVAGALINMVFFGGQL